MRGLGVDIRPDAPDGAAVIETADVDLGALASARLRRLGSNYPGWSPSPSKTMVFAPAPDNEVRFEYLQGLLAGGGDLRRMVYTEPPAGMTRMDAVRRSTPGVYLMDTGAAAVLGALGDPVVAEAASSDGAILVNVGNMHTFATLLKGRRLFELFEHHGRDHVGDHRRTRRPLATNTWTRALPRDLRWARRGPRPHVPGGRSIHVRGGPGPNRRLARGLGFHEAAPHGDMMLAGAWSSRACYFPRTKGNWLIDSWGASQRAVIWATQRQR